MSTLNCKPQSVKIIYSLKIHIALQNLGFNCVSEMRNPKHPNFNCWVYEATPSLLEAFDLLIKEGSSNGK